jgi:antitoxin component YwqK of YwqJK toxin-antitoxin module
MNLAYCQKNPVDSTFYSNGAVKSVFFKNDWVHKSNTVDVYYDLLCDNKEKNIRVADSAKGWIKEARRFYKDSTFILQNFGGTFSELKGISFHLESYELNHISIYFGIEKDSLINKVSVKRSADNADFPLRTYKTLCWMEYKKPTEIKELSPIHLDDEYSALGIKFYNKYFVEEIIYSRPDYKNKNRFLNTQYLFYLDNKMKQQGTYLVGYGRTGRWYVYYENGRVSTTGDYCGSEFDSKGQEIGTKKTGKWIYYTKQGCVEREENWDNGVLIK